MRYLRFALSALMVVFVSPLAFSGQESGGLPGYFMAQGMGARALGMGGAHVGVADDASATYWNPAGLAQMRKWEAQWLYTRLYEDTKFQSGALAGKVPFTTNLMFGLGYMQLSSVDFIRRDASNNPTGTFSDVNRAFFLGIARPFPHGLSLGLSVRNHYKAIDDYSQSALDGDVGLMWRPISFIDSTKSRWQVSLGAVARNIAEAKMQRTDISDVSKRSVSVGGAVGYNFGPAMSIIAAYDHDSAAEMQPEDRFGVEIGFGKDRGCLRAGMDGRDWSMGGGIRAGAFFLNYAMLDREGLGGNHNISASYKFWPFKVLRTDCLDPTCEANAEKITRKLDSCGDKARGIEKDLKDCDEAGELIYRYIAEDEDNRGVYEKLKERHAQISLKSLNNVLVVCNIVSSSDVQVNPKWDEDLHDSFANYIGRKVRNLTPMSLNCSGAGSLEGFLKLRGEKEHIITIEPQILYSRGGYVLRIRMHNVWLNRAERPEIRIKETGKDFEDVNFRKYADMIVDEFIDLRIEK